jgi:hypothetical protein
VYVLGLLGVIPIIQILKLIILQLIKDRLVIIYRGGQQTDKYNKGAEKYENIG